MEQYIPKSALTAEIERRKDEITFLNEFANGTKFGLETAIDVINSLEVKEVDLEEKAIQLSQKYFPDEENIWARPNIEAQKCKSACIEMVEWFKAQKGEEV